MRESDLTDPVREWLRGEGCEVWVEVPSPYGASHIDMVGYDRLADEIYVVELKMTLSRDVLCQAYQNNMATNKVYAAVPTKPKKESLEQAKKWGVGVLRVVGAEVIEVLEPAEESQVHRWKHYRERLMNYLDHLPQGGVAGKPMEKGVGPAQDCLKLVKAYKEANPKATWKEIYANVPNHYASYKSMSNALGNIERMLMWREYKEKKDAVPEM